VNWWSYVVLILAVRFFRQIVVYINFAEQKYVFATWRAHGGWHRSASVDYDAWQLAHDDDGDMCASCVGDQNGRHYLHTARCTMGTPSARRALIVSSSGLVSSHSRRQNGPGRHCTAPEWKAFLVQLMTPIRMSITDDSCNDQAHSSVQILASRTDQTLNCSQMLTFNMHNAIPYGCTSLMCNYTTPADLEKLTPSCKFFFLKLSFFVAVWATVTNSTRLSRHIRNINQGSVHSPTIWI